MSYHITEYCQREKQLDGCMVYTGEDAKPYACDEFFFIMDGLGGSGAFRHTTLSKRMFDSEGRKELLIPRNERDDDKLAAYTQRSFLELDAVRDRYDSSERYQKNSGYFGSRVASVQLLSLLRHDAALKPQAFWDAWDHAEDAKKKQAACDQYASKLRDRLLERIEACASKAHLIKEKTAAASHLLLPTTIALMLTRETEDGVDVLCLWAGDSRLCVYGKDGTQQLSRDDENKIGAVTSLINLTSPELFTLNRQYRHFEKPIVLYGITDGFFDGPMLNRPFLNEYHMLDRPLSFEDPERKHIYWNNNYEHASTDDSATISINAFGISTAEELRAFALARIEALKAELGGADPEVMVRADYVEAARRKLTDSKARCVKECKDILRRDSGLLAYAREQVRQNDTASAEAWKSAGKEAKAATEAQARAVYGSLREHWTLIRGDLPDKMRTDEGDQCQEKILDLQRERAAAVAYIKVAVVDMANDLLARASEIQALAAEYKTLTLNSQDLNIRHDQANAALKAIQEAHETLSQLEPIAEGKCKQQRKFIESSHELEKSVKKLLDCEDEKIEKAVDWLTMNEMPSSVWPAPLVQAISRFRQAIARERTVEEDAERALEERAAGYIADHLNAMAESCMAGSEALPLSQDSREALSKALEAYKTDTGELQVNSKTQGAIFEKYNARYGALINP